jgi:hypothetical protein
MEISLDSSRRLAATDNKQHAVARHIFAVLIPHETVNESIRHGGRAKVFDYLFSGRGFFVNLLLSQSKTFTNISMRAVA